jgi:glycosyltransferase involved in cell wall biosynthesis
VTALVLTSSFPVQGAALGGRFVARLLCLLAARGWRFVIVTPSWGREACAFRHPAGLVVPAEPESALRAHGLAHRSGILEELARRPWEWWRAPGLVLALAGAARRLLAERPFDLVWSHWLLPCGLAARLALGDGGPPHLATAHGADVHLLERWSRAWPLGAVLRRLWRGTSLAAPVAHTARRVAGALRCGSVRVLPLAAGAPRAARREGSRTGAEFLFLGRFEPIKGADRLLAAARLLGRAREVTLTLAGAGSQEVRLKARAREWGLAIDFPGVIDGAAKRAALARARALVLPSRRTAGRGEGFPHAAMEALVARLPVVAPARGALGEYLAERGGGFVFDDGGAEEPAVRSLAQALERALAPGAAAALAGDGAAAPFENGPAAAAWDRALRDAARRVA